MKVQCWYCGHFGHKAKNCWYSDQDSGHACWAEQIAISTNNSFARLNDICCECNEEVCICYENVGFDIKSTNQHPKIRSKSKKSPNINQSKNSQDT